MKIPDALIDFILKEWLLIASAVGLVLTSVYIKHFPSYSIQEMQVLYILFVLFVTINGLRHSGLIGRISQGIEKGNALPFKLVTTTFFLSMLVTNDAALVVIVPLTLAVNIDRKDILVILEALAANAGSALTPFGNPQNLYIYWFYGVSPGEFFMAIAPFSLLFLIILCMASFFIESKRKLKNTKANPETKKSAYVYGFLLIVVLLAILHVLPVTASFIVIIYALLFDRKALHVDYALLFSFLFFFGLAENMNILLATELKHAGHVFLVSALASQIMSNVPATLLFAKFTTNWEALLWGVNTGGFGSLFGSLANLIAYKLYVSDNDTNDTVIFTAKFLFIGYLAFFLAVALYIFLYKPL